MKVEQCEVSVNLGGNYKNVLKKQKIKNQIVVENCWKVLSDNNIPHRLRRKCFLFFFNFYFISDQLVDLSRIPSSQSTPTTNPDMTHKIIDYALGSCYIWRASTARTATGETQTIFFNNYNRPEKKKKKKLFGP